MQDELLDLQQKVKKTIIFITHDLNEALRIGDRIALMKDGKIIQIGTGEEILTNPANDYVKTFLEDVDRSKVLTVENVMIRPISVNIEMDGPKVALKRMREEEVSVLLAVDKKRDFKGYITADDALEAAKRELLVETGYSSNEWRHLLTIPSQATIADNYAYLFEAKNCFRTSDQHLDETEFLKVEIHTEEEVNELIKEGKFQQALHILAMLCSKYR